MTQFNCTKCGSQIIHEVRSLDNNKSFWKVPHYKRYVHRLLCNCGCLRIEFKGRLNWDAFKSVNTVSLLYKDRIVKPLVLCA